MIMALIILLVIGVIVQYTPMAAPFKNIAFALIGIAVLMLLLSMFGIIAPIPLHIS